MPEICLCGDKCCANRFPASYRQARTWERDWPGECEELRDHRRMTSGEPDSAGVFPAVPDASLYRRPGAPKLCEPGCHDWGAGMVIIGVVRCARCDKLSTVADFPVAGDLWNGDHERDVGPYEDDALAGLPLERGRRKTAVEL